MFWKKKNGTVLQEGTGEIGMLGMDTVFKGDIRFRGTLRIDGMVLGGISSAEGSGSVLIINQQAEVKGNIVSDSVLISGKVVGKVKALERIEIFRHGSLRGDVVTGDIMIEGGAEFEGNCQMIEPPPQPPKSAKGGGSTELQSGKDSARSA